MAENEILKSRHAFGSEAGIAAALEAGKIDSYDILFLKEKKIGWIDADGNPVILEDEAQVIHVSELPEVGEEGKIYIFNTDGYFWDGEKFVNLCKPTDVSELESDIEAIETELTTKANVAYVDAEFEKVATESVATSKAYTDKKVEAAVNEYLAKRYEISGIPDGTLVSYGEKEIRVMCPENTVFEKQSVGTGGDPNCYYMTFKTYAPNDNAVGYIEHLGDLADEEILTSFSVDKYGRRYQSTWLSIAKYDASTNTWTYKGKESGVNGYVGWDYQIDWYDANGKMIGSDSIRINLSNESCHFVNSPYYVNSIMKEVDTKIETKIAEVEAAYEVIEF